MSSLWLRGRSPIAPESLSTSPVPWHAYASRDGGGAGAPQLNRAENPSAATDMSEVNLRTARQRLLSLAVGSGTHKAKAVPY